VGRLWARRGHDKENQIAQATQRLNVGVLTVRQWVRTEQCPVVRDGGTAAGPMVIPGVTSCLVNH
jgi:hypothetical protein